MTRYPLQSVIALGVLITSISGAGVVAVFTDTATTGTNTVSSGDETHLDALQIAQGSPAPGGVECGTFNADLQTGIFSIAGAQPGDGQDAYVCLRNDFSAALSLSVLALDLIDTDSYCTNEEGQFDTSCGTSPGELSGVLAVSFSFLDNCATPGTYIGTQLLSVLASDSVALRPIGAGETDCLLINTTYSSDTSPDLRQAAQTDEVTWRFAFTGSE